MSDPVILIPARMASTRLPGKPLADIGGEPMIVHVWRRAMETGLGPVVVATDTPEIIVAIEKVGGIAVLTRADHPSGSDRIFGPLKPLTPRGGMMWWSMSKAICRPLTRARLPHRCRLYPILRSIL